MKKILLFFLVLPFFGFSQDLYWYDVFFELEPGNADEVTTLVDSYYSSIDIPDDVSVSFSRIPMRGEGSNATHLLSMFSASSESLANFRNSLKGDNWDLYISGMTGKVKGVRTEAGNVLSHVNLDKIGPIGQAWMFKVHAKDTGKFVEAFSELMKTFEPNGLAATGQLTHGANNGESMFIYATSSNLNEALASKPKNKKEAKALQDFFEEIAFAEFSQTNTRVEISKY